MDFDKKYNIIDENSPRLSLMTARYKKSFAYYTLKERLPVILTQVLDNLTKDKEILEEEYGDREELKEVIGNISKLKYELQTDKEIIEFSGAQPDIELWNTFISKLNNENKTFFSTCWLYAECYMYRKLKSFFEDTNSLKNFDYFRKQKENALTCSSLSAGNALELVVKHTRTVPVNIGPYFRKLLKLNLWGNRCDLSISEGKEIKQIGDPFTTLDSLEEFILVDNTEEIWSCLSETIIPNKNSEIIIDIVCDNAGYELFTDLLVAEFLIDNNIAKKIRFHVKCIPWFISDVNKSDFHWTLNYLHNHKSEILKNFGEKLLKFLDDKKFELIEDNYFWTSPYEFYRMQEIDSNLYQKLSEAYMVIFKGDLNYRKLLGDFTWDFTENFRTCLRGFHPTNLCTLRTVKADLICGLKDGIADDLNKLDSLWMTTGQYGVIQFAKKNPNLDH